MVARLAIPALALACAIPAIAAVGSAVNRDPTSYAATSGTADLLDALAGLSLVLGGALAWIQGRARSVGLVGMLAGLAWLAPDWEGWVGASPLVRSVGAAASLLFLPLLFHLSLALPAGRLHRRSARLAVVGVYAIAALVAAAQALFRDPFLDPYCWRTCLDNAFLVHPEPRLADAARDVWVWAALGLGAAVAAVAAGRLVAASPPARRVLVATLVPLGLVGVTEVVYAVALLRTPLEDPDSTGFATIFLARAAATTALGLGLGWSIVQARRTRASVSRLATELAEAPSGELRDGLAAALGDPDLQVHYWLPGSERFVAADGSPAAPPEAEDGRATTPIARAGRTLAVVSHDAALLDGRELEHQIGAAARLAIDNERLQAEVLAQLRDLRGSRARIVEASDAERRRLERNLHDGAQQRLLAVSYDLRVLRASAERDGELELGELAERAIDEIEGALGELRELAEGIYPAILTEAGLGMALASLADAAPLPVELGDVPADRLPETVERTAYYAVEEAIHDAHARGASFALVRAHRASDMLAVTVEDDGAERELPLVHLLDRAGAIGGTADAGARMLRVELPCA